MSKINEFNQGGPELPEGSVTVPEPPVPEVLQATTSGVGISKSPRKTTAIYTRRKTKARTTKNPRRKWEKSIHECIGMFIKGRGKRDQKRDWENSARFVDRDGNVGN